jgi:hypothetical protein
MHLDQAQRWAYALTGGHTLTVQVFDDRKPARHAPECRGGDLADLWPWILQCQSAGCGIFGTVQQTPNGERKASDVTAVRAVFVDVDGRQDVGRDWHLPPTMTVASGRGLHAFWALDPWPAPDADSFRRAQKRLVAYYDSDPAVCDLPRVMRLAGTLHQKGDPVLVQILTDTGAVYHPDEVLRSLPELPPEQRAYTPPMRMVGGTVDTRTLDVVGLARAAGLQPRRLPSSSAADPAWAIDCPWRAEHTDGAQGATSTVVWERGAYPAAFRCLHSHCVDRRLADFLRKVGVSVVSQYADAKPTRTATAALQRAAERLRGIK